MTIAALYLLALCACLVASYARDRKKRSLVTTYWRAVWPAAGMALGGPIGSALAGYAQGKRQRRIDDEMNRQHLLVDFERRRTP